MRGTFLYVDTLPRLRAAVRRKRPEKWRTNRWFLLHDNSPAHRPVLVKDFLANNNVTTLEHPLLLTPAEFYPFPSLKSELKWRSFCDATNIIKNATEELNRLSQNGSHECFQHFYVCCQMCIAAQEDYFEGSVA